MNLTGIVSLALTSVLFSFCKILIAPEVLNAVAVPLKMVELPDSIFTLTLPHKSPVPEKAAPATLELVHTPAATVKADALIEPEF